MTEESRLPFSQADIVGLFLDVATVEVLVSGQEFGYMHGSQEQFWIPCFIRVVEPYGQHDIQIALECSNAQVLWERLGISVHHARLSLTGMQQINERLRRIDVTDSDTTMASKPKEDGA